MRPADGHSRGTVIWLTYFLTRQTWRLLSPIQRGPLLEQLDRAPGLRLAQGHEVIEAIGRCRNGSGSRFRWDADTTPPTRVSDRQRPNGRLRLGRPNHGGDPCPAESNRALALLLGAAHLSYE